MAQRMGLFKRTAPQTAPMSGAEYMPDAVVFDRDSTAQGNVLYSNISAST
jgi:hypothetical protein